MFKTGALISPPDDRDYSVTAIPVKLPDSFRAPLPIIGEQKVANCVNWSMSYAYEMALKKQFSKGYIYGERFPEHYQGEGMYPREACAAILKYGNVLLPDWNREDEVTGAQSRVQAAQSMLRPLASKHRIKAYARVSTPDEIKTALHKGLMVSFSAPISGWAPNPANVFYCESPMYGNHMMTVVGWNIKNPFGAEFDVINSWGKDWGKNGLCYMFAEHILSNRDAWALDFQTAPEPSPIVRTLRKGMKGDDVKELQEKLIKLGLNLGKWGADGDFGSATRTAVKKFQKANKLTADGIVGAKTWGVLNAC